MEKKNMNFFSTRIMISLGKSDRVIQHGQYMMMVKYLYHWALAIIRLEMGQRDFP